jgi:hypothetical protein
LTYPQVIMLQHAAWYNRQLLDKRLEAKRQSNTQTFTESLADAPMYHGKRFDELSSDDLIAMSSEDHRGPKIIKTKKDPPEDEPE